MLGTLAQRQLLGSKQFIWKVRIVIPSAHRLFTRQSGFRGAITRIVGELNSNHLIPYYVEPDKLWPLRALAEVTLNRVLNHLAQFFQRVSLGKDIVTQSPRSKTSVGLVFTDFEDDF